MDKVEAIEAMARAGIFPRIVSHDDALAAAQDLIDAFFGNEGRGVLTGVPAREDHADVLLVDYIKQQRAAALTAAEPFFADVREQWLPIETAPKDGTPIVAWCVHPYASSMTEPKDYVGPVIAYWIEHNGGGWTWHGHLGNFTHWRPLPDPPVLDEVGG